jgi:hypothetical protein
MRSPEKLGANDPIELVRSRTYASKMAPQTLAVLTGAHHAVRAFTPFYMRPGFIQARSECDESQHSDNV